MIKKVILSAVASILVSATAMAQQPAATLDELLQRVEQGRVSESKEHKENILTRPFREVGFGVAIGKQTDGYRILWVQCFGKPPR